MMDGIVSMLVVTLVAGTPLVYAALGELVTERSGVLNLGVEGTMLTGAISGFIVAFMTGNVWLGVGTAMLAGAGMSLLFAILAVSLKANQVAVGLALTIFGTGLSSFVGKAYVGKSVIVEPSAMTAALGQLPVLGALLGKLHPLVWLSWLLLAGVSYFVYRSRAGLILRAVGESPSAAYAIGYPVIRIRYLATLFGGAMAGIGGAYVSIVYTALWTEGLTAGRGWIAVALVVFATWRPGRVLLGAYLFGGVTTIQLFAQGAGFPVPPELMSATPYIATILVLVLISRDAALIRLNVPASLGKPFHAEA
jgi:simple sugar transport system permease protein